MTSLRESTANQSDLKIRPERDHAIEGLRGFAALMVFYHHLMLEQVGGWSPSPGWTWFVSGPTAVLIFFVLSGYVIRNKRFPSTVGRSSASAATQASNTAAQLIGTSRIARRTM